MSDGIQNLTLVIILFLAGWKVIELIGYFFWLAFRHYA